MLTQQTPVWEGMAFVPPHINCSSWLQVNEQFQYLIHRPIYSKADLYAWIADISELVLAIGESYAQNYLQWLKGAPFHGFGMDYVNAYQTAFEQIQLKFHSLVIGNAWRVDQFSQKIQWQLNVLHSPEPGKRSNKRIKVLDQIMSFHSESTFKPSWKASARAFCDIFGAFKYAKQPKQNAAIDQNKQAKIIKDWINRYVSDPSKIELVQSPRNISGLSFRSPLSGYCVAAVPTQELNSNQALRTAFHEIGHAIHFSKCYSGSSQQLEFPLYFSESIAMLFECLGADAYADSTFKKYFKQEIKNFLSTIRRINEFELALYSTRMVSKQLIMHLWNHHMGAAPIVDYRHFLSRPFSAAQYGIAQLLAITLYTQGIAGKALAITLPDLKAFLGKCSFDPEQSELIAAKLPQIFDYLDSVDNLEEDSNFANRKVA